MDFILQPRIGAAPLLVQAAFPEVYGPVDYSQSSVDPLAMAGNAETAVGNVLYNGLTGNLTAAQIAAIQNSTDSAINTAAGGNAALSATEQALANQDLTATVNSGYYGGAGNVLADVQTGASGLASASSGLLAWVESNWAIVFAAAAAFVVFRPDKTLFGRR